MNTLVVEDDPSTQLILERILSTRGHHVTLASTAEAAMDHAGTRFFPLIILDVMLPGMNGIEFCRWLRSRPESARQYVLVGTGTSSSDALQELLHAGANDYIAKPYNPALLRIRLAIAEAQIRVLDQRKELEDRLQFLARTDPLTSLANRAHLDAHLAQVASRATPSQPSALLYIDLDNFKVINDTLGHGAGDRLLTSLAGELRKVVQKGDTVARFGGDEFVVVLEGADLTRAETTAARIRDLLDHHVFREEGRAFPVGGSIGLIVIDGSLDPKQIMAGADAACYRAKAKGRNRIEVHQGTEAEVEALRTEADWRTRIRDGLRHNLFFLWGQPIAEIKSGHIAFREALLRLGQPGGSPVSPDAFLPAARRYQLMVELDRRVLSLTLQQLRQPSMGDLSVNLSVDSLADPDFESHMESAFSAAQVEPRRVILEISEQGIIENFSRARRAIEAVRRLGFRVALDDFGAGFSSLKHLSLLPLDLLKIDGTFIQGLAKDHKNRILVKTLADMSRQLSIQTVAEFVDGPETLAILRDLGVDYAQGRHIAMPGPLYP